MSNVLKENYKKLVDALAPYFGGASDFDDLTNRPLESDAIDIDDLDLPMPAKPTDYPVLFDESGTEYQVGWYRRASDGKVKPVWRKDFILSTTVILDKIQWTDVLTTGLTNFYPLSVTIRPIIGNNTDYYEGATLCFLENGRVRGFHTLPTTNTLNLKSGSIVCCEYTKTTDSWKEV